MPTIAPVPKPPLSSLLGELEDAVLVAALADIVEVKHSRSRMLASSLYSSIGQPAGGSSSSNPHRRDLYRGIP